MNLYKEQSQAHIRNRLKSTSWDQEQHNLGSGKGMEKMCLEPTSTIQPPVQASAIQTTQQRTASPALEKKRMLKWFRVMALPDNIKQNILELTIRI